MASKAELTHELRMINKKIANATSKKAYNKLMDKRMSIIRKMK